MNDIDIEYYKCAEPEGISKSDIFLKDHYEKLFYMTPKELAESINAMNEDELIQFNKTIHKGSGTNVDLMNDKLDEMNKYQNLNSIFINASCRISFIDGLCNITDNASLTYEETFHKLFTTFKYFFEDESKEIEDKEPNTNANLYDMSIKIFPEKADNREREALNTLASKYLIDRELQSSNKYRLTKPVFCRQVVKELIKLGYNQNSGLIFMNNFIEYHVDPATIPNYFRTSKRDMPINSIKNV
jgi:L-rhamnose mutarotase